MVSKNFLVILMMISVGLTSAENTEPDTSNSTSILDTATNTTTTNASAAVSTIAETPKSEPKSSMTNCVAVRFTLDLNDKKTTSTFDEKNSKWECDSESDQSVTIGWNKESRITFHFKRDVQTATYMLSNITVTVAAIDNKNSTVDTDTVMSFIPAEGFLKTPTGKSYNCTRSETLQGNNAKTNVTIHQFEAFRAGATNEFSSSVKCPEKPATSATTETTTDSTVAIAVICSLLALVVVAVVGYIIWRKRNNSSIFGACTRN